MAAGDYFWIGVGELENRGQSDLDSAKISGFLEGEGRLAELGAQVEVFVVEDEDGSLWPSWGAPVRIVGCGGGEDGMRVLDVDEALALAEGKALGKLAKRVSGKGDGPSL